MSADRAYDIVNLRTGGSGLHQPHVRVRCNNCTGPAALLEFQVVNSPPPEHIAKKIRSKGWEFVLENRRYTRCPECIRLRDAARKGESPGPKQAAVELFGRTVSLPVAIVPPELVPPPPPVREPRILKDTGREPAPEPEAVIVPTRDIATLAAAVTSLSGNIAELVATMKAQLAVRPAAAHVPVFTEVEVSPLDARSGPKPREQVAKIRQTMAQKSKAYTERVRNALQKIRREKKNGRELSPHEYAKHLTMMGIERFHAGRPWTATIVQKHLDAMDSR